MSLRMHWRLKLMNTDSGAETDDDDVDSGAPDVKDIHGLQ